MHNNYLKGNNMKSLSITMNGSPAIKLGTIYKCNSVKSQIAL